MADLRTDFEDGELFLAEYINETNRAVNDGISTAAQAAEDASSYLSDLQEAIADLPDGQAVTAEVAQHTVSIEGLKDDTNLGEDTQGNTVTPTKVFAVTEDPEFAIAFVDANNTFLFGIRKTGEFIVFNRDLTRALQLVDEQIEGKEDVYEATSMEENEEFMKLITDDNGRIVFGIKTNGDIYFGVGVPSQIRDAIDSIDISSLDGITELIAAETTRATSKENEIAGNVTTLANQLAGVSATATSASEDAATALNLAEQAIEEQRYEIQGDVTNNPDEEDITVNSASKLCLKDRVYSPSSVTTKGYVILRQGTALSTQMSGKTNTIFEVRYIFDLNNATLELPENSTLLFVGGKFSNGTIQGNKSVVTTVDDILLFEDVTLTGTWNNTRVDSRWFNFETSELVTNHDDKVNFGNLMALANGDVLTDVYIQEGYYHTTLKKYTGTATATMVIPSHTHIHNMGTIEQIMENDAQRQNLFLASKAEDVLIEGGTYIGDCDTERSYGNRDQCHCIKIGGSKNVILRDLNISDFWGDGIDLIDADNGTIDNDTITVERVVSNYNGRQGISIESGHNIIIRDCQFCYTGRHNHSGVTNPGPCAGLDFEPWNGVTQCKINKVLVENVVAFGNICQGTKEYDLQYIPNVWYRRQPAEPNPQTPPEYFNTNPDNEVTFVNCRFGNVHFEDANGAKFYNTQLGNIHVGSTPPINFSHDGTGITSRGASSAMPSSFVISMLSVGFCFYDESNDKLKIYNGETWTNIN